jgi:hypothetical protein
LPKNVHTYKEVFKDLEIASEGSMDFGDNDIDDEV